MFGGKRKHSDLDQGGSSTNGANNNTATNTPSISQPYTDPLAAHLGLTSSTVSSTASTKQKSSKSLFPKLRGRSRSGSSNSTDSQGSVSVFSSKCHPFLISTLKIIINFISERKQWHKEALFLHESNQAASSQLIIVEAVQSLVSCIAEKKGQQINQNGGYSIEDILSKHVDDEGAFWASAIKIVIKGLPEPLIPIATINRFIEGKEFNNSDEKLIFIKQVLSEMPFENWSVLCDLCSLLKSCLTSDDMRLSHLFCALILSASSDLSTKNHEKLLADIDAFSRSFQIIIKQADQIFDKDSAAALFSAHDRSPVEFETGRQSRSSSVPFEDYLMPRKSSNMSSYSAGGVRSSSSLSGNDVNDGSKSHNVASHRRSSLSSNSVEKSYNGISNSGPYLFKALALFDFNPETDDELELRKGDVIEVINIENVDDTGQGEWWYGRIIVNNTIEDGIFPKSYCERVPSTQIGSSAATTTNANTSVSISQHSSTTEISTQSMSNISKSLDATTTVFAKCLYDFEPEYPETDIKLYQGERIIVVQQNEHEWWTGRYTPTSASLRKNQLTQGLFPRAFVTVEKTENIDIAITKSEIDKVSSSKDAEDPSTFKSTTFNITSTGTSSQNTALPITPIINLQDVIDIAPQQTTSSEQHKQENCTNELVSSFQHVSLDTTPSQSVESQATTASSLSSSTAAATATTASGSSKMKKEPSYKKVRPPAPSLKHSASLERSSSSLSTSSSTTDALMDRTTPPSAPSVIPTPQSTETKNYPAIPPRPTIHPPAPAARPASVVVSQTTSVTTHSNISSNDTDHYIPPSGAAVVIPPLVPIVNTPSTGFLSNIGMQSNSSLSQSTLNLSTSSSGNSFMNTNITLGFSSLNSVTSATEEPVYIPPPLPTSLSYPSISQPQPQNISLDDLFPAPISDEEEAVKMGWIVTREDYAKFKSFFLEQAERIEGQPVYATAESTSKVLLKSGLPKKVIARIMEISDIDRDLCFDCDEFVTACHVTFCVLKKQMPLPSMLPPYMIPDSKRHLSPPSNMPEYS